MNIRNIVNRNIVNLDNCDQEPIHIPGSIQPHGFLLGVSKDNFDIVFCSENADQYIGISYKQLLGKNIKEIFGTILVNELEECKDFKDDHSKTIKINYNDKVLEFAVHANDDHLVIEMEDLQHYKDEERNMFDLSKEFLGYMEDTHTLQQLCALVTNGVRKITGYDRVMVYRFDKDYNGEVIAESKRDDLESFLGLHYPHTDIPVQARTLYLKNLLRIIADVNYVPVPIYTIDNGKQTLLDLSHAVLRSVSPIHVQYLHNIGVGATLTISLIHKKKLWGLIACHHYSPKYLSHEIRTAAKLQGHFITSQIDVRQLNEEYEASKKVNESVKELLTHKLQLNRASLNILIRNENLLSICQACGVSILVDNQVFKNGVTPDEHDIKDLASFLAMHTNHTHFVTNSVLKTLPDFKHITEKTAGLNYYSLDNITQNCIIWYKPETISEVFWAGDPSKAIEKDKTGLSPRKSFESWKETVKYQSNPWLQMELQATTNFTNVLQKHLSSVFLAEEEEKQRELAQILSETNAELENINWISTHDLQEPLRKIQLISSFILSKDDSEVSKDISDKIMRMNKSAERMQNLVKDILKYTRLNYSKESFVEINLNETLSELEAELSDSLTPQQATLIYTNLPIVHGVPFLLKQLFSNLIYNSLKFAEPNRLPMLTISSVGNVPLENPSIANAEEVFHIIKFSDNGIGFEKDYNESVFNIFTRLHTIDKYQGSGIGLALCKKIMNTHRGYIKADGTLGKGVDFYLYFPK